jgi:DNA-binding transcriptional regulator YhcF (GntR family)
MIVVVDRGSEEPVYAQIARQVRASIVSGDLEARSLLPPVRALASDLGVNLNTVARAYRLLEEHGFVRIWDRSGVEVAAPASRRSAERRDRLREELRAVLARMREAGFSPSQLVRLVEREVASLTGPRTK